MSSYETAVVRVQELAAQIDPAMKIVVQPPYYQRPDYIAALVASMKDHLAGGFDHLLFSFHGIPERHIKKSDPTGSHCLKVADCCHTPCEAAHQVCYKHQCIRTAEEVAKGAGLPEGKWSVSFQSRLGRDPWIKPYTDLELERLAKEGVQRILVMCPAFVSDCLETLEEIRIRGKESFVEAGGKDLEQIPCLNEHPLWIDTLETMSREFLAKN
jgi:ferrochelatase